MSKTFYTKYYSCPKEVRQKKAMISTLAAHRADIALVDRSQIIVTWDCTEDETEFNDAWKEEAPRLLNDVAQSVLATIKSIDSIDGVGMPFEQLFYWCDEVLGERDVEEALSDLEALGLVELQQNGWVLKIGIALD
jgi:hypothetical protein